MRTDYESVQHVEVNDSNGNGREIEFVLALECVTPSTPATFDPMYGGDPGSEAEYEINYISLIDEGGNSREIEMAQVAFLLGDDIYQAMLNAAILDALENDTGPEFQEDEFDRADQELRTYDYE